MNERDLLEAMGELARQQETGQSALDDPRWARFCAGTLSPEEETALREEANRSVAGRAALEAFQPLGKDFHTRMAGQIAAEIGAVSAPTASTSGGARDARAQHSPPSREKDSAREQEEIQPARGNVVSFFRARLPGRVPMALAAGLVAALGIAVLLNGPPGAGPLPGYDLAFEGQVMQMRSSAPTEGPLVLAEGNRMHLLLTPDTAVSGPLEVRVLGERGAQVSELVLPAPRISESGSVLFEGELGRDIQMPEDLSALIVVLGRPGTLPADHDLLDRLAAQTQTGADDWKAWRLPMRMD